MGGTLNEPITPEQVEASVREAKAGLAHAAQHLMWQIDNQVWLVTGHAGWDEFREAFYDGVAVILQTQDRKELVPRLRLAGMTHQQIADTLGVSHQTVARDIEISHQEGYSAVNVQMDNDGDAITNRRGQARPASYRRALDPEVMAEAEDVVRKTGMGGRRLWRLFKDRGMTQDQAAAIAHRITGREPIIPKESVTKGARVSRRTTKATEATPRWRLHVVSSGVRQMHDHIDTLPLMNEFANLYDAAVNAGDTEWCEQVTAHIEADLLCLGRYLQIVTDPKVRDRIASGHHLTMDAAWEPSERPPLRAVESD